MFYTLDQYREDCAKRQAKAMAAGESQAIERLTEMVPDAQVDYEEAVTTVLGEVVWLAKAADVPMTRGAGTVSSIATMIESCAMDIDARMRAEYGKRLQPEKGWMQVVASAASAAGQLHAASSTTNPDLVRLSLLVAAEKLKRVRNAVTDEGEPWKPSQPLPPRPHRL